MAIRVGLDSTKVKLTEVGKKWFLEHYPQGIVYEYDPDKAFDLKSMGAEYVEVICPMGIPYVFPIRIESETTFKMADKGRHVKTEWKKRPVDLMFREGYELKTQGKCPTCKKPIDIEEFRDDLSWKEYGISGMCQSCQDSVFEEASG